MRPSLNEVPMRRTESRDAACCPSRLKNTLRGDKLVWRRRFQSTSAIASHGSGGRWWVWEGAFLQGTSTHRCKRKARRATCRTGVVRWVGGSVQVTSCEGVKWEQSKQGDDEAACFANLPRQLSLICILRHDGFTNRHDHTAAAGDASGYVVRLFL